MNITQKPHLHQDWIDPHATGIVRALQNKGHTTYLVGGCVRDLLLNIQPKDYDIATDAKPNEVKNIIHRAYVIGKRFRLVLVRRDEHQFEVATFRRDLRQDENRDDLPEGDNIFGTPEEDAKRRDFTINGLFYDPINDQLIDYADGLADLEERVVKMIGEPDKRLSEDPIRILRALRLKHMIGFVLDPDLRRSMEALAETLASAVLPRRREEILKLLRLKRPTLAFLEAYDLGILAHLSPTLHKKLADPDKADLFWRYLHQSGKIDRSGMSPGELFGLLVHAYVRAFVSEDPLEEEAVSRSALADEEFQTWMRDELGMFKIEQALAVKALHIVSLLARRKEFQRKGERRQRALLTNEAFPQALLFARADYALGGEDLLYWTEAFDKLKETQPEGYRLGRVSSSRQRRRRHRGRHRSSSSSRAGSGGGEAPRETTTGPGLAAAAAPKKA